MKVGDIVRQTDSLIKMKGRHYNKKHTLLGTVVKMQDPNPKIALKWRKQLGNLVDVLWSNGRLSTNFAESGLEIIASSEE